jgi:carbonic anhydrase
MPERPVTIRRRSFLLGTGLTALGLTGDNLGASPAGAQETPRSCRPKDPLQALKQGNERFAAVWQSKNRASTADERAKVMASMWLQNCFLPSSVLDSGQAPWATILTCADSRVSPEWVFDAAPSDLFVIRSAGNTAFDEAIASMEYSVDVLETPLIMVMGHSSCGAVDAARGNKPLSPLLERLVDPIRGCLNPADDLEASVQRNALNTAQQLTRKSELLAKAVSENKLQIVVSYFNIGDGIVNLI